MEKRITLSDKELFNILTSSEFSSVRDLTKRYKVSRNRINDFLDIMEGIIFKKYPEYYIENSGSEFDEIRNEAKDNIPYEEFKRNK